MKKILIAIWNKIKQYRAVIIMYLMPIGTYSVMLIVSIISDIVLGGFNIIKYIAYAVLLAILVIVMVVYRVCVPLGKDKIKQAIDDVENKLDNKLN